MNRGKPLFENFKIFEVISKILNFGLFQTASRCKLSIGNYPAKGWNGRTNE